MKLFLVKRNKNDIIDYDEYDGFVIRANSENQVKEILSDIKMSMSNWENSSYLTNMTIQELKSIGTLGIVLSSYQSG